MGSKLGVDRLIAYMRECDTVMTEPEMAAVARKLQPHLGKPDPDPRTNIVQVAEGWTAYLKQRGLGGGITLSATDVCVMMVLLKSMRLSNGFHKDSILDIAGYAQLVAVIEGEDDL